MRFDVPFIPDEDYVAFLGRPAFRPAAVHFSLHHKHASDARKRSPIVDGAELNKRLSLLSDVRKYGLLNSVFHDTASYFDRDVLLDVLRRLETLAESDNLHGVVFADAYLLSALAELGPQLCSRIEAVPSVNFGFTDVQAVERTIEFIAEIGFQPPRKIVLDRSLNRNPVALTELSTRIRKSLPGLETAVLINEGCLQHCPFRIAHGGLIAFENCAHKEPGAETSLGGDCWRLNMNHGCLQAFVRRPGRLLASPFVRPEDIDSLDGAVDMIKLCGRTRGPQALKKVVEAYANRRWDGNLFQLLDTTEYMAEIFDAPNAQLPEDFFDSTSSCGGDCDNCSYCDEVAKAALAPKAGALEFQAVVRRFQSTDG